MTCFGSQLASWEPKSVSVEVMGARVVLED